MHRITALYARLKAWANDYEPAVARSVAAAVFQLLAGLGIAVGDLPKQVDAVLAFVAIAATVLAGRSIRKRVDSPKTREKREAQHRAHDAIDRAKQRAEQRGRKRPDRR